MTGEILTLILYGIISWFIGGIIGAIMILYWKSGLIKSIFLNLNKKIRRLLR